MKKFLLAIFLLLAVVGVAQAQDNDDNQFWPDLTVSFKLKPAVTLNLFGTARLGRDGQAFVTEQLGATVNFRLSKNFSVTPSYRHLWSQPTATKRSQEDRYFLDFNSRLPLPKGFAITDRNRGEIREIDNNVTRQRSWRYRNRLQVERPVGWHELKLVPYISGEMHYDSRYHVWSRQQFWAGSRVPVTKHWSLDVHYSRNIDERSVPGHWHVLGVLSRLEF
ncbi:MAG: DUF2490 domain-containing protein [Blastocatellia bacterium]